MNFDEFMSREKIDVPKADALLVWNSCKREVIKLLSLSRSEILLLCGELSALELRTVKSVLESRISEISRL